MSWQKGNVLFKVEGFLCSSIAKKETNKETRSYFSILLISLVPPEINFLKPYC